MHICCSAQYCCLLGRLLGCARFYLVPCLLHRLFPWFTRSGVDRAPSSLICCHISRDIRELIRECYSCSISVTGGGCRRHLTAFPFLIWLPHLAGCSTALASESLFIKVCVTVPYYNLFAEAYVSNSLNNGELSLTYTYLFIGCVRLTAVIDIPCPITKNCSIDPLVFVFAFVVVKRVFCVLDPVTDLRSNSLTLNIEGSFRSIRRTFFATISVIQVITDNIGINFSSVFGEVCAFRNVLQRSYTSVSHLVVTNSTRVGLDIPRFCMTSSSL
jgi:hypothetical protein